VIAGKPTEAAAPILSEPSWWRQHLSWRHLLLESNSWIFLVLVGMVAVFSIISPQHIFFTTLNIKNIALAACEILVLAVGETFIIITGSIDLSIGSVLVLSSVLSVDFMFDLNNNGTATWITLLVGVLTALGIGALTGFLNGIVITIFRIPSFIVTLGSLGIALGVAELFTSGSLSKTAPDSLVNFGISSVAGIPSVVLLALGVTLVFGLLLATTRFGLHCYAIGSSREGARRAGIPVDRVIVLVFTLMGFLAGIAAIIDLARFSEASVASHQSDNLAAIAGVIIGGASLFGGRGTVWGTFVGTLVPVVLLQGLVIQNVNPYWQNIAIGSILVVAVGIDQFQRERLAKGEFAFGAIRKRKSARRST
jgi:ribose transport system permease protein